MKIHPKRGGNYEKVDCLEGFEGSVAVASWARVILGEEFFLRAMGTQHTRSSFLTHLPPISSTATSLLPPLINFHQLDMMTENILNYII